MNDEYLWDRSGEIDPEIADLERLLQPLAHDGRPFAAPAAGRRGRRASARLWPVLVPALGLAASVLMLVGGTWASRDGGAGWTLESLDGMPRVGSREVRIGARVMAGDEVTTDAGSRARIAMTGVGAVELGPATRVRVAQTRSGAVRLWLRHGSLDATISAAPGVFTVDTPAARAVDLGCRYTLHVDAKGQGVLHVTLGWVGLQWKGRESLVPAGAFCATRATQGPGTPYFEGATPAFIQAVSSLDGGPDAERAAALASLIEHARPLDAITLWHLLTRLDRASAARIYDRLAALMPPPAGVTKDRVLRGDQPALGAWWEGLGLGNLEELRKGLRGSYR